MQLQTVDIQGLRQLQALYRREWPKYCQEFAILKNLIAFAKDEPGMKHVRAYSLQDPQAQRLGLFLIVDRYQLFVGCLGESLDLLAQALHLLDWSSGMLCTSIPERYIGTVLQVMQEKQLVIEFHHLSDLYHIPAKQALQFHVDCPKGFQLKSLSEQDAHILDQEWPYSHEGSLFFIQRQIRLCPSMGLYDENTQQLVAWCIRTQDGLLATLHVQNAYKRRGFGSLIVRALARRIAALGDDVTAEIYAENIPSVNMFNNLGFRVIDQCHWLKIAPATGSSTWPEGE